MKKNRRNKKWDVNGANKLLSKKEGLLENDKSFIQF